MFCLTHRHLENVGRHQFVTRFRHAALIGAQQNAARHEGNGSHQHEAKNGDREGILKSDIDRIQERTCNRRPEPGASAKTNSAVNRRAGLIQPFWTGKLASKKPK